MKYLIFSFLMIITTSVFSNSLPSDIEYKALLSKGHTAFNEKNYEQALGFYQSSYLLNDLHSTLYNIASCQFKLKQWSQALASYLQVQDTQSPPTIIDYQIAVIYKKLNNLPLAKATFHNVLMFSEDDSIVVLASKQVEQLSHIKMSSKNKKKLALLAAVSVNGGYDSNVISADDGSSEGSSDVFADTLLNVNILSSHFNSGVATAGMTYYESAYKTASDYNVSMLGFYAKKFFSLSTQTKLYLGANYSSIALNGEAYSTNYMGKVGAVFKYNKQKIILDYSLKKLATDNENYEFLDGFKHQLAMYWTVPTDSGAYRLSLKGIVDRRTDKTSTVDELISFTSYSSDQFYIQGLRDWQLGSLYIAIAADYKLSAYIDSNIVDNVATVTRNDDRISLSAQFEYAISKNFNVTAELSYTDQQSTVESYEFTQAILLSGITYRF